MNLPPGLEPVAHERERSLGLRGAVEDGHLAARAREVHGLAVLADVYPDDVGLGDQLLIPALVSWTI